MLKSQAIICSVITSWGRLLAAVGICDKMEVRLSNTGLLHPAHYRCYVRRCSAFC